MGDDVIDEMIMMMMSTMMMMNQCGEILKQCDYEE